MPPDDDDRSRKPWLWLVLGLLLLAILVTAFVWGQRELFPDEPTDVQVPSVTGLERSAARDLLADEGLEIDDRQRQCSDQYDSGYVVEQDPEGDSYVEPGSEVALVLSSGPCDFAMPDVTGDVQRVAVETLTNAGIKRNNIMIAPEECDTDEPANIVVEQTPQPEASVGRDDTVSLCLSDGPEVVPQVIGKRQGEAERLILEAGFQVDVREDNDSERPKGEVTDVIPGEGEELDQDETVTIFVSVFEEEEEPTTSAPPPETDTDDDGLSDTDEAALGTDPDNPDTDGDSFTDGEEVEAGSDPLDPLSVPLPNDNGNGNGNGNGNDND